MNRRRLTLDDHSVQSNAVGKCFLFDSVHRTRDRYFRQARAILERLPTDASQRAGERHARQTAKQFKCLVADFRHGRPFDPRRNDKIDVVAAIICNANAAAQKNIVKALNDRIEGWRRRSRPGLDGYSRISITELRPADSCFRIGEEYIPQIDATLERRAADLTDVHRNDDALQPRIISEGIFTDRSYGLAFNHQRNQYIDAVTDVLYDANLVATGLNLIFKSVFYSILKIGH